VASPPARPGASPTQLTQHAFRESPPPTRRGRGFGLAAVVVLAGVGAVSCGSPQVVVRDAAVNNAPTVDVPTNPPTNPPTSPVAATGTRNVYAATMSGKLSPAVQGMPFRVYVPNSDGTTVSVIDPATFTVIDHLGVGRFPEHIAPAHDLSKLYVDNEGTWSLSVIDPTTAKLSGDLIPLPDPYNLYFTPDGTKAIVVQERLRRLEFRDPTTWKVIKDLPISINGIDHLDFSADGKYFLITTEYSGMVAKVDVDTMTVVGWVKVGGLPIDVRLSPDGTVFYIANQGRSGVSVVDGETLKEVQFINTGRGAHGLYVSRDTRSMYVSNRLEGTISVIDMATRTAVTKWKVGGSPDMLQLNPDGTQLWMSSRYDATVIVVDTATGTVIKRIYSGSGDHGLCYFPAPGNISLGHNGVYR
jgi:YVTN family beta-propeller protein